jgi:hypothetical protein
MYNEGFHYHHNREGRVDVRQNLLSNYPKSENCKSSEFHSDARIIPLDEIDRHGHYGRDKRELLSHSADSNDLSSRRDRLASRIESQRKDRFTSNKYSDTGAYKGGLLDARNEINKKFATDLTYNNRRDFLNSQLNYERNPITQEEIRYESDKSYGLKSNRYFEPSTAATTTTTTKIEADSYGKKDLFADSGIEVDYRTKDSSTNNRKYNKPPIHDTDSSVNTYHTQNVTRVELRNQISDDDDIEMDENIRHHNSTNHYSDINDHKIKTANTLISTRLVQEQKHNEAIPTSTVLIRHWVPSNKEDISNSRDKHTQVSKTKPERSQQPSLSDDEYEYEKSTRDEYRKQPAEEYKKNDDKTKENYENGHKNVDKKVTKKKQSSTMDKMRQLFTRSEKSTKKNKKKQDKVKVTEEEQGQEEQDILTSRYTEYRGSDIDLHQESPRTPHKEKTYLRCSNMELEQQETPRPAHKNWRPSEPSSPKNRRRVEQDTSYQSPHRGRNHHTKMSNTDLDEGTPRPSYREGNRGGHPAGIEEEKVSVSVFSACL